ncbi:Exocyst complex component [Lachnellula subtilissima]|uniref:Exocyst complex component n=1 Tax=Lachnellula subtilissima TaxID=602034 RepID=A0A8H8RN26_9HELO|nr:Exocyst complex component [Lachnellula subtilissima]
MTTSPISSRAKKCIVLFDELLGLPRKSDALDGEGACAAEAVDCLGRFNIWAGNIGALQRPESQSSLDYRLRDASKIATQIVDLLDELAESIEDVVEARGQDLNAHLAPRDTDEDVPTPSNDEQISEIKEIFESITDAINNLFRLSMIIRNNTSRDRYAKAAAAALSVPFDDNFDISHVEHKFPALKSKGKEWLVIRLGKSITKRRQYLRYCREHHDKISREHYPIPRPSIMEPSEIKLETVAGLTADARSAFSKPTSTLAPTQASTLLLTSDQLPEDAPPEDSQSQTSYATSNEEYMSSSKLRVIKLEDISKGASHFECPYCWQIQASKSQKSWKKHVLSDLKPYVCTYEKCELKLFPDHNTWFSHELRDHRKQWHCYFCSHSPFDSLTNYQNHLKHRHPVSFVEDQLPALLELSQKPVVKISPAECPFCDDWEKRLRDVNKHIPLSETLVVTPTQFKYHVGAHMEQLALFAIPRGYTEDGEADSGNAAQHTGSEGSSLSLSTPDSEAAMDLRACEDFLMKMMDNGLLDAYFKYPAQTCRPTLEEISQALASGRYDDAASFTKDFRQMFDQFTHDIRRKKFANTAFTEVEALEEMKEMRVEFIAFCHERENLSSTSPTSPTEQWRRWRAERIPAKIYSIETASKEPGILVNCRLDTGQIIQGWFESTALMDDVLAFVECYDLLHQKQIEPGLNGHSEPVGYDHQYQFGLMVEGSKSPLKYLLKSKMQLSWVFRGVDNGGPLLLVVPSSQLTTPTELEKRKSNALSNPELPLVKAADRLSEVPNLRLTIFGVNGLGPRANFRVVPNVLAAISIDDHEVASTDVHSDFWNLTWNENFYVRAEGSSNVTISIVDERSPKNQTQGLLGLVRFRVGDMIDLSDNSQEKKYALDLDTTAGYDNLAAGVRLSIELSTNLGNSHKGSAYGQPQPLPLLPINKHSTGGDVEEEEAPLSAGREEKTNTGGGAEGNPISSNVQLDSVKCSSDLNSGDEDRRAMSSKPARPDARQPSDPGSVAAASREKPKGGLRNLVSKVFRPLSSRSDLGSIARNNPCDKPHDEEPGNDTKNPPPSDPAPVFSRAEKFEDEKRRLIESCFSKNQDGIGTTIHISLGSPLTCMFIVAESYITHIRVTEDVLYPASPPPPTSNPNNMKKSRLIVVAVRISGRIRVHKARENDNGTFSIGKTWQLDDLTAIKSFDTSTAEGLQELQYAKDVGFTLVLGKPYYWEAKSVREKLFFIASLVKIYTKYKGGKVPELTGFDSREREQLLGVSAPAPPPAPGLDAKVQEELNDGGVQHQMTTLQASLSRELKMSQGSENLLETWNTKKGKQTKETRQRVEKELNESNRNIKLLKTQISDLQRSKISSNPTALSTSATSSDGYDSEVHLYQSVLKEPCSICGKLPEHDGVQTVPCEHKFHLNCLIAWQRNHGLKCPQWQVPSFRVIFRRY